jgi:RimJ/RimL family protein N-acetyltransferase
MLMIKIPDLLEDNLIKLVPLSENDFENLYQLASDPLIWEQHPTRDRYKKEIFKIYFDSAIASASAFLIIHKDSNELVGCTRYYDYNEEESRVAIGYTFLARKFWGGNYNRVVKKLMLDYAFQFVNVVIFHIGPNNIRSQTAIQKIGAKKTREMLYEGQPHYEYEIQKKEWSRA